MLIKTLYCPIKDLTKIEPVSLIKTYNLANPMSNFQAKKFAGAYTPVYNDAEITRLASEFWAKTEKRLIALAVKYDPSYVPTPLTMNTGDKLSKIRHDLKMAIYGLFRYYARRVMDFVDTYSFKINTYYLEYHWAVIGNHVAYYDAENVASSHNFIPPHERTPFGKRKTPKK